MAVMKQFDISQLTEELKREIVSCKTAEELKAFFAAKKLYVPDSKLESILKLKERFYELELDTLKEISGAGGCRCSNDEQCSADESSK